MISLTEFRIQKLNEVDSLDNFYQVLILEIFQELKNLDKKYEISNNDNYYSLFETDLKAFWAKQKRKEEFRNRHIAQYGSSKMRGINNLKDKISKDVNDWVNELKRIIAIEISNVKPKVEPSKPELPKTEPYKYDYSPHPSFYNYYNPPPAPTKKPPTFGGRLVGGLKGLWKGLKGESFEDSGHLLSEITDDLAKVLDKINYWIEEFRKRVLHWIDTRFADFNSDYENKQGYFWEPSFSPINVSGPSATSPSSTFVAPPFEPFPTKSTEPTSGKRKGRRATTESPSESLDNLFSKQDNEKAIHLMQKDREINDKVKKVLKGYLNDFNDQDKINSVVELFKNQEEAENFINSHEAGELSLSEFLKTARKLSEEVPPSEPEVPASSEPKASEEPEAPEEVQTKPIIAGSGISKLPSRKLEEPATRAEPKTGGKTKSVKVKSDEDERSDDFSSHVPDEQTEDEEREDIERMPNESDDEYEIRTSNQTLSDIFDDFAKSLSKTSQEKNPPRRGRGRPRKNQ